jgi:hypothetical protein
MTDNQTFTFDVAGPLAALMAGLVEAGIISQHPHSKTDGGRSVAHGALLAVIQFLDAMPGWGEARLSQPLHALSAALLDRAKGIDSPMLALPPAGHRMEDPTPANMLRLYGSYLMQTYMNVGMGKGDAAKRVAAKLHSAGCRQYNKRRTPIEASTVIGWRDRYTGHSKGFWPDRYRTLLEGSATMPMASVAQVDVLADQFIKNLVPKI